MISVYTTLEINDIMQRQLSYKIAQNIDYNWRNESIIARHFPTKL